MYFNVYKSDKDGQWRWRLVHANGNILGDSAEGYHNKGDCTHELHEINKAAPIDIVVEDD